MSGPGRPLLYTIRDAETAATPRNSAIVYLVGAGTLADLPGRVFEARLEPPALIVVRDVVKLQSTYAGLDSVTADPGANIAAVTAGE